MRDHNAAFLAGACHYFPHFDDPEIVEILAGKKMLQLVVEENVHKIHVDLDSQAVVHMITNPAKNILLILPRIS